MIQFNDTPRHIQDELNTLCQDGDHSLNPEGFFNRIQATLTTSPPLKTSAIYNVREELCAEILTLSEMDVPQLKVAL